MFVGSNVQNIHDSRPSGNETHIEFCQPTAINQTFITVSSCEMIKEVRYVHAHMYILLIFLCGGDLLFTAISEYTVC